MTEKEILRQIDEVNKKIEALAEKRLELKRKLAFAWARREKPQVQTEALTRVVNQDANKSLTD